MFFNHMFFPPSFPVRRNYIAFPDEDSPIENTNNENSKVPEIIETPKNQENKRGMPFEKIFSFLDLEFDDLLILGILFFLYMEKCDDLLLYGALFLLLFDIELDSLFKFF